MNDSNNPAGTSRRQMNVRVNDQKMTTEYSNAFRTHAAADEVLIDFGFNLVQMNPNAQNQPEAPAGQMQLDWQHRIVLSYRTAKNLAVELGRVIQAYEKQFGEIKPPQAKS